MPSKFITVMLSSRCNDPIQYNNATATLSDVRKDAKQAIEDFEIGGEKLYKCWINELAPSEEGTDDSWEKCLKEAGASDILIALYNGNAGWTGTAGGIGICHAELERAFSSNPNKVQLIALPQFTKSLTGVHARMSKYVGQLNLFRASARNGEELIAEILKALGEATRKLAKAGVGETGSSIYHLGEALDWSRLDFEKRKTEIERVLSASLEGHPSGSTSHGHVFVRIANKKVLFQCHGIPAAMSVSAARELVGQPFLRDHELTSQLTGQNAGPVHLIGCHKGVSESQAISMLGHPDAIIVDPKVGIYVADPVQKTQLLLLRNCRDETSTRHAVQRAIDWLERSGEGVHLANRATSRAKICKVIAKRLSDESEKRLKYRRSRLSQPKNKNSLPLRKLRP